MFFELVMCYNLYVKSKLRCSSNNIYLSKEEVGCSTKPEAEVQKGYANLTY